MSAVNPVVLIQMIMRYANASTSTDRLFEPRTFVFHKNNTLRIHKETEEETKRRKSHVTFALADIASSALKDQLKEALSGRVGKVWIDPELKRMAVPIETSTGNEGFGVLPTGSRIKIPEGKFIRAFTYWEKVNDIDLSAFSLDEDWSQHEFSWRNMFNQQSQEIAFSGDQTSGYYGGSEYFDVNVDLFKLRHPAARYLVFCNNVYSGINFAQCDCKAGFMIREEQEKDVPWWKGERECRVAMNGTNRLIFDPKTVATSYKINAESMFAYLFAIDLKTREMVWLNMARNDSVRVAGMTSMSWLKKYLTVADIFNISDLYGMAGTLVNDPNEADIIVSDRTELPLKQPVIKRPDQVHSWDAEKIMALLRVCNR